MRPPRLAFKGGVYHATCKCNNNEFSFKDDDDFQTLLNKIEKAREKYGVKVHAFCLLHNHYHLLVSTPENDKLSLFFQYVNGQYARAHNKKYGRKGHFWGERFFSNTVEANQHLLNTFFYIELNMVRANAVAMPEDWKWSSYSNHATGEGVFKIDYYEFYLELGNTDIERQKYYKEMMKESMLNKGLLQQQIYISKGGIIGTKEFVERIISNYGEKCHKYYKAKKPRQTNNNNVYISRRIKINKE